MRDKETITIPLNKVSYEDLEALTIEQQTQLFVKDKEIEILKTKWDKLKKWANVPKVYICHYHILDKMNEIEQGSDKE